MRNIVYSGRAACGVCYLAKLRSDIIFVNLPIAGVNPWHMGEGIVNNCKELFSKEAEVRFSSLNCYTAAMTSE
jgi:hypothetical protein